MILSMRGHGTPIGTSIIMGIGRGIMLKHNRTGLKEFGGLVNLNRSGLKVFYAEWVLVKGELAPNQRCCLVIFKQLKNNF